MEQFHGFLGDVQFAKEAAIALEGPALRPKVDVPWGVWEKDGGGGLII